MTSLQYVNSIHIITAISEVLVSRFSTEGLIACLLSGQSLSGFFLTFIFESSWPLKIREHLMRDKTWGHNNNRPVDRQLKWEMACIPNGTLFPILMHYIYIVRTKSSALYRERGAIWDKPGFLLLSSKMQLINPDGLLMATFSAKICTICITFWQLIE